MHFCVDSIVIIEGLGSRRPQKINKTLSTTLFLCAYMENKGTPTLAEKSVRKK